MILDPLVFLAGVLVGATGYDLIKIRRQRSEQQKAREARLARDLATIESFFKNTPGWHTFAEVLNALENYLAGTREQTMETLRISIDILKGDGSIESRVSRGLCFDAVEYRWSLRTQEDQRG